MTEFNPLAIPAITNPVPVADGTTTAADNTKKEPDAHGVARDQLRAFVERIERLEEEKKTVADDIRDVYGEAKAMGFDTKALKKIIALRKKDDQERMEEELILSTYLVALGMAPEDVL